MRQTRSLQSNDFLVTMTTGEAGETSKELGELVLPEKLPVSSLCMCVCVCLCVPVCVCTCARGWDKPQVGSLSLCL